MQLLHIAFQAAQARLDVFVCHLCIGSVPFARTFCGRTGYGGCCEVVLSFAAALLLCVRLLHTSTARGVCAGWILYVVATDATRIVDSLPACLRFVCLLACLGLQNGCVGLVRLRL
jgi:hypothetical protein